MSQKTRINRPSYATPRKSPAGRLIHTSTAYAWIKFPGEMNPRFVKVGRGTTYRGGA